MIILITGQPGAGKTALLVDMLANDSTFAGRPLFVGGVPDLTIEHQPVPPVSEWTEMRVAPEDESLKLAYFTFPAKAVIAVDEAQRIYRPRATGSKVPPEVQAFETHRHTGVDFFLLTQHPGLLDANIRKLVGKHIHIAVTPFGRYRYEWTKCADPENRAERDIAARSRYTLPKRAFELYKSSELHTKIKTKIPMYAWVFLIALVACLGMAYYIYGRIMHRDQSSTVEKLDGKSTPGRKGEGPMSKAEYYETLTPRLSGLYHTASRYDDLTKPTDAPFPMACVDNHKTDTCRCIDQQGNKYTITIGQCRQIVANGIFKDWGVPPAQQQAQGQPEARHERSAGHAPSLADSSARESDS